LRGKTPNSHIISTDFISLLDSNYLFVNTLIILLKSRKTKSFYFHSDINTVIFWDGIKCLNVLKSFSLFGLGSVGELLERWIAAVVDLLWLEIGEHASGANNVVV
jgi:hypothetical protein